MLDLMHKHRDDIDNVPFLFLTPTRRPISRPSSRASTHSARLIPNRPDTPNSAPSSPLAMIFRRPHTPVTSPLGTQGQSSSYITARSESPTSSTWLSGPKGRLTRWDGTTEVEREPQKGQRGHRRHHRGVWRSVGLSWVFLSDKNLSD